jgi:hypothetical protein
VDRPPDTVSNTTTLYPLRYLSSVVGTPQFIYTLAPGASSWVIRGASSAGDMSDVQGSVTLNAAGQWTIMVTTSQFTGSPVPSIIVTSLPITVKNTQTITFPSLGAAHATTEGQIVLQATASSGLPVSYRVSGPAQISGSSVVLTGAGVVTVTASQAGDGTYLPASDVSRTFTAIAAPTVILERVTAPGNDPSGKLTGAGWALDYYDGAPIALDLYIDGVKRPGAVTVGVARSDVQAASVANGWSTKDVTNSGFTFSFDATGLADNPDIPNHGHEVWIVGTNTKAITAQSTHSQVSADKNGQVITVDPVGLHSIGDVFTLSGTATSGHPVAFGWVSGPATVNGNAVTVGSHGGTVVLTASVIGDAIYQPASVTFSFVVGDPNDADGNGVDDRWEQRYGIHVTPTSDANGDGVTDRDCYNLGLDPTADYSNLSSDQKKWGTGSPIVSATATILTKGPGTVTISGAPRVYTFTQAAGVWGGITRRAISGASPTCVIC